MKNGKDFTTLHLLSELQFEVSRHGAVYGVRRKARLNTNLTEQEVADLIGTTIPGEIVREATTPYKYKLSNGEELELSHRWRYQPEVNENEEELVQETELELQHSENGTMEELSF